MLQKLIMTVIIWRYWIQNMDWALYISTESVVKSICVQKAVLNAVIPAHDRGCRPRCSPTCFQLWFNSTTTTATIIRVLPIPVHCSTLRICVDDAMAPNTPRFVQEVIYRAYYHFVGLHVVDVSMSHHSSFWIQGKRHIKWSTACTVTWACTKNLWF